MTRQADRLLEEKKWPEAKPVLENLVKLYPDSTGPDSAYRKLATAYRALGETNAETQVLTQFAEKDDEATDACLRLMDLGPTAQDWAAVQRHARRYLAVDPLVAPPYRFLARASEAAGQIPGAIAAYQALLQLDPPNPAEVHFRLARLLHENRDPAALKQKLPALQVMMLTVYEDSDAIFDALKAGASGYLLKRSGPVRLLEAIKELHQGGAPMTSEIARKVIDSFHITKHALHSQDLLTAREEEVLQYLAKGYACKEIAAKLSLSYETVRVHLRHVYQKLHVHSRTEAVLKYRE